MQPDFKIYSRVSGDGGFIPSLDNDNYTIVDIAPITLKIKGKEIICNVVTLAIVGSDNKVNNLVFAFKKHFEKQLGLSALRVKRENGINREYNKGTVVDAIMNAIDSKSAISNLPNQVTNTNREVLWIEKIYFPFRGHVFATKGEDVVIVKNGEPRDYILYTHNWEEPKRDLWNDVNFRTSLTQKAAELGYKFNIPVETAAISDLTFTYAGKA